MLVQTIMGIHQEDFVFEGEDAEEAALAYNLMLRRLIQETPAFENVRITGGIFDSNFEETSIKIPVDFAMRWTLHGLRDHAGATRNENRRDAGIAAARLVEQCRLIVDHFNLQEGSEFRVYMGAVKFVPGENRNVIPGEASLTIGISGPGLTPDIRFYFQQQIQAYIVGTLTLPYAQGGEGITSGSMQEVHSVSKGNRVTFSIDLRSEKETLMKDVLAETNPILDQLAQKYRINVRREIIQKLPPYHLEKTGQVLQLERSYGGSHNPNETQLARDVLRGIMMQLSVNLDHINEVRIDHLNLYRHVRSKLPETWKERCQYFISGALHDTCNISRRSTLHESSGFVTSDTPDRGN